MEKGQELARVRTGGLIAPAIVAGAYIAAIAGAEIVSAFLGPHLGIICDGVLLILLLGHYLMLNSADSPGDRLATTQLGQALAVLSLLPLLRILSLTMPAKSIPEVYWNALIGVPLLIAAVLTVRLLNWRPGDIGLTLRSWWMQPLIALSGIPLSVAAYVAIRPAPPASEFEWPNAAIGAAILIIFGGFMEEFLFRGLLQRVAGEIFGRWSIVLTSLLFAMMFVGSRSAPEVALMGLIGLFFSWCVERTGSIWGVVLTHALILFGIFYVLL